VARRKKYVQPKYTITPTKEEMADFREEVRATPTRDDLARAFGADRIVDYGDEFSIKLNGAKELALYDEIDSKRASIEDRRTSRTQAATPTETLVDPSGRTLTVDQHHAEHVAHVRGLKPRINWGRPSRRFVNGRWYDLG